MSTHQGPSGTGMNTRKTSASVLMKGSGVTTGELAGNLANQLGRYVIDRTAAQGSYDFALNWSPEQSSDSELPSLFTALREQAGLRLQAGRGPMSVLVVESIEKPSEN